MKAPTGPKDSNGRTILEGDRVARIEGHGSGHNGLVHRTVPANTVCGRYDDDSAWWCTPAYLLTITHRSGRPIDEVSPLQYDEHGRLFEEGCLVGKLGECDTDTRRQDRRVLAFRGGRIITSAKSAWGHWCPSELRIIPDEPEVREVTLTLLVEDGADPDAIQLPKGIRRKVDA
jgi:hypothetical protein